MKNRINDKIKIFAGYYIAGFILILFSMSVLAALGCLGLGFISLSWLAFAKCLLRAILFSFIAICLAVLFALVDYEMLSGELCVKMRLCSNEAMKPVIHNAGINGKYFCCPVCGDRVDRMEYYEPGFRYCVQAYDSCKKCGQKLDWTEADFGTVCNFM